MAVDSPLNAFSFDISLIEIGQEIKLLEQLNFFLDHLYKGMSSDTSFERLLRKEYNAPFVS
jgi:hypothetical protein